MIGIRTPDDVVFLADCISSESTLDKYQITFIYDIAEYLNTLDKVGSMEAAMFVPAHSDVTSDITGIVQLNRQKVFDISNNIQSSLKTPMCFEELLKLLFDEYGLVMNFEQYVLVGSTVRSYLSWLKDNDKIRAVFTDNQLMWSSLRSGEDHTSIQKIRAYFKTKGIDGRIQVRSSFRSKNQKIFWLHKID